MRIKLDENVPHRLVEPLAALSHDVDTVADEGLLGAPDLGVWEAAQREQRFLITQDLDFADARRFPPGSHHGILILRLRLAGRDAIFERINTLFTTQAVDTWAGCLVIAADAKVRVRRPGTGERRNGPADD